MGNTVKYQFCTPSDYPKYVRFLKGHVVSEVLEQAMEAAEH